MLAGFWLDVVDKEVGILTNSKTKRKHPVCSVTFTENDEAKFYFEKRSASMDNLLRV